MSIAFGGGPQITKHQYVALDGLRGLAALVVVGRHCPTWFTWHQPELGYLAVDFFFLLSGFVLAHSYDQRLRDGPLKPTRFMFQRLIRLLPLYFLALAITVVAKQPDYRAITLAVFILPNFEGRALFLVGASWSLFFEIIANWVFGFMHRRLTTRALVTGCVIGLVGVIGASLHFGKLDLGFRAHHFIGGLPRVTFSFFLGVLIYRTRKRVPIELAWSAWPCGAVLLLLLAIDPGTGPMRTVTEALLVAVAFPALVIVASRAVPTGRAALSLSALGASSYAIYILHPAFIELIKRLDGSDGKSALAGSAPWSGIAFVIALCLLSWLLHYYADVPLRRYISRGLLERRAQAPVRPLLAD